MTNKAALQNLLAKVEAGHYWSDTGIARSATARCGLDDKNNCFYRIMRHGSLDAAHSLHKAVLSDADWSISPSTAYVKNGYRGVKPNNPARAWLIAIIKALIAEAGE